MIASAIAEYHKHCVPRQKLLTDFADLKKHKSQLAKGVNHWADLQIKIKKNPVERGVTIDETLFDLSAWKLKDEKASDVVRSLFYSNARNVSAFECGFLFDIFARSLCQDGEVLIVNPSPDFILKCFSDDRFSPERTFFAVPDDTIAFLYNQEFSRKITLKYIPICFNFSSRSKQDNAGNPHDCWVSGVYFLLLSAI